METHKRLIADLGEFHTINMKMHGNIEGVYMNGINEINEMINTENSLLNEDNIKIVNKKLKKFKTQRYNIFKHIKNLLIKRKPNFLI